MADVTVDPKNKNHEELMQQGMRAFMMGDYSTAVQALSIAIELLVAEHGDKHDKLGDVYYCYGKSLLELYREESEPLGDAVTKKLEEDEDDDDDDEDEDESEGDAVEGKEGEGSASNGAGNEGESSSGGAKVNGEASGNKKEEIGESTEETEEEPTDLQVAWEVLELAKLIYENRAESGRKELADTLVVLGEVSLESENFEAAVNDIKKGLEILESLPNSNERVLAETHYKLGMALSTNSQMDEAISSFTKSLELLQGRIKNLEEKGEEKEEVEQMKGLVPEIEEKIADMKSFKEEAYKTLKAGLSTTEPQTSKFKNDTSAPTKANDISHLVKRKRNLEEVIADQSEEMNPSKKISP